MPKNANQRQGTKQNSSTTAMKLFIAGFAAELFLMLVIRFFKNGNFRQVVQWNDQILPCLSLLGAGAAIGAAGAMAWCAGRESRKREASFWWVCAAVSAALFLGLFFGCGVSREVAAGEISIAGPAVLGIVGLAAGAAAPVLLQRKKPELWRECGIWTVLGGLLVLASGLLARWDWGTLTAFSVAVPAVTVLAILWTLFERGSAMTLTALGLGVFASWVCYRGAFSVYTQALVRGLIVLFLVVLALTAWAVRSGKLKNILPASADLLYIYAGLGLSFAGAALSLITPQVAFYVMGILGGIAFGFVVYLTVKQL